MNTLRVGLALVLALVAAGVANLVLLGVAQGPNDPVGKLSPRAELIRLPPATTTTRAAPSPSTTTTALPTARPGTTTTTQAAQPPGTRTTTVPTAASPPPSTTRPHADDGHSGRQQDD